ncbi:MAG: hypothetical protein V2A73_11240 [Pseudomonadota bacterium]
MAFVDDIRRRMERLAPRERRLIALLTLTALVLSTAFGGSLVRKGISEAEANNAAMRDALENLSQNREKLIAARHSGAPAEVKDAPPLATYLDTIANETGVQIPETTERSPTTKGKVTERAVDIKLRGITLQQLAEFLRQVETRSQRVLTQRLFVKPRFNARDTLDVELTVAAFEQAKSAKSEGRSEKKDAGGGTSAREEEGK